MPSATLLPALLLTSLLSLTACATAASDPVAVLPVPVEYSREFQRQAAAEMEALAGEGRAPALRRMIVDYGRLRAELRARP